MTAEAPGRVYRVAWLEHLRRTGAAEARDTFPESWLEVPALAFGDTDLARPGIVERQPQGAGATRLRHPPVAAYLLRDAVIHTLFGVVTCGESVVGETTSHVPLHRLRGAGWTDETHLRLPEKPPAASLKAAIHLLVGNQDNYFHWLLEGMSRFDPAESRGFGVMGEAGAEAPLLVPPLDAPWKQQSLGLMVSPGLRYAVVNGDATVRVERLLYLPQLSGGGLLPHIGLLRAFDRMRAAAYTALRSDPAPPHRKLFVSRADSTNRVLVNEAELAALAAASGFERVVLGAMPVAEQARLFAEATHIVAPHGAGLTNLLFCRPGTAVCELQMDCNVHWAFRRLAALRGLRYGCVVGPHTPPLRDWMHHNSFGIAPAALVAVLADPRFLGG